MPTTFANTINGNEILAKRAERDYAGNDLQTTYATKTEVTTGLSGKQDTISDLATIRSGAQAGATAVQPSDLATVATTGAYSDLSGTPTIVNHGKIYGMDGTESYNDIYTKMTVDGIGITWVLDRVSPYVGKATYTACQLLSEDSSTNTHGFLRLTCVMRANVATNQITVFMAEAWGGPNGFSTPTYSKSSTAPGSYNQVYSWNSRGEAIARNINEVPSYTTSEDGKVLGVVDNQGTAELQWVADNGVTDVEVNGTSVVNASGVAEVTVPAQVNADWNSSSGASEILNKPTIPSGTQLVPAATSADEDKVLTVDSQGVPAWASAQAPISAGTGIDITNNVVSAKVDGTTIDTNASGELTVIGGGGGGTQADWTEDDPADPSYIENKPTPKTLTAGTNIVITEDSSTITVTATAEPQVNADWNASSGVAQILNKPTIPSGTQLVPAATSADADKVLTVDAQGTPAWATAQAPISAGTGIDITNNVVSVDTSVVATQTDLAGKEDAFDVGTGLEMDTSGATPTLQVEAPVDIVAGPGIVIDNPDGNTLRVSTDEDYETVLWSGTRNVSSITLSEAATNFEYLKFIVEEPNNEFRQINEIPADSTVNYLTMLQSNSTTSQILRSIKISTSNYLTYTMSEEQRTRFTSTNTIDWATGYGVGVVKVVGIHRIASN